MSVLLPPAQAQKVMIMGGGHQDLLVNAVASTAIVDLNAANPHYVAGPPLDTAKMYVSAVILPDSTVFETGGASTTIHNGNKPVFSARSTIRRPRLTKAATPTVPRVYHSSASRPTAVPPRSAGTRERLDRIEIYKPPYLQTNTPRPTITSGATEIALDNTYAMGTTQAAPIKSAVLVRPAAVTHSSDSNQRLVDLPFTETANGISVTVTNNQNLAPGWYMLSSSTATASPRSPGVHLQLTRPLPNRSAATAHPGRTPWEGSTTPWEGR
jgi:hypothetical protein